jgi:hypothetical protein
MNGSVTPKDDFREEFDRDVYAENNSGSFSNEYVAWLESKYVSHIDDDEYKENIIKHFIKNRGTDNKKYIDIPELSNVNYNGMTFSPKSVTLKDDQTYCEYCDIDGFCEEDCMEHKYDFDDIVYKRIST